MLPSLQRVPFAPSALAALAALAALSLLGGHARAANCPTTGTAISGCDIPAGSTYSFPNNLAVNGNVNVYGTLVTEAGFSLSFASTGNTIRASAYVASGSTFSISGALTMYGGAYVTSGGAMTWSSTVTMTGAVGETVQIYPASFTLNGAGAVLVTNGVELYISTSGAISIGASGINATGGGYAANSGPGWDGVGAAHGGLAGGNSGALVGSFADANSPGSGGSGSAGGGKVVLDAGTTLAVSATIQANGANVPSCTNTSLGGGAGGSIILIGRTGMSGSGTISANGGNGCSAGRSGGGGRVIGQGPAATGLASATAYGGTAGSPGGAGTVYYAQWNGTASSLTVSNNGTDGAETRGWFDVGTFKLAGRARYRVSAAAPISYTTFTGDGSQQGRLIIDADASLPASNLSSVNVEHYGTITGSAMTFSSGTWYWHGEAASASQRGRFQAPFSFTVGSGGVFETYGTNTLVLDQMTVTGTLRHAANTGTTTDNVLNLQVRNLTVGGSINCSAMGFTRTLGPGFDGTGAAHGGYGASETGTIIGTSTMPQALGSGGATGTGGGSITLTVTGTLSLTGNIQANASGATTGSGMGAAGGSVYVYAATINGGGSLQAMGGAGTGSSGGGGGGRIYLQYDAVGSTTHPGRVGFQLAYGGNVGLAYSGGAGSVVVVGPSGVSAVFDNNTSVLTGGRTPITGTESYDLVTLRNGARLKVTGYLGAGTFSGGSSSVATGRLEVEPGGTICGPTTAALAYFDTWLFGTWTCSDTVSWTNSNIIVDGSSGSFSSSVAKVSVLAGAHIEQRGLEPLKLRHLELNGGDYYNVQNSGPTHDNMVNIEADNITLTSGSMHTIGRSPTGGPGLLNGGAGHGGLAWTGRGAVYGDVEAPTAPGTVGTSGKGGGVIRLKVADTLTLTGASASNIQASGSGCSSGGSIWITTNKIAGAGYIGALGGDSCTTYAGGGGRVALYYQSSVAGSTIVPNGRVWAYGRSSTGSIVGGAGTVFMALVNAAGTVLQRSLVIDNLASPNALTPQLATAETYDVVTIKNGARYVVGAGQTLTVNGTLAGAATNANYPYLQIDQGGLVIVPGPTLALDKLDVGHSGDIANVTALDLTNATFTGGGTFSSGLTSIHLATGGIYEQRGRDPLVLATLAIDNGGVFRPIDNGAATFDHQVNLDVGGITVASGGTISASSRSPTGATIAAGANHGGLGGGASGATYDSVTQPALPGTANGSSKGGGVVRVSADVLTLNGTIAADADSVVSCAGASGGAVWIDAPTIAGTTGQISARGGPNRCSGNTGGGGRVAVYFTNIDPSFLGTNKILASVTNLSGNIMGSPGTVYLEKASGPGRRTLIVDNNGVATNVPTPQVDATESYDVFTLRGGARYAVGAGQTLDVSETLNGGPVGTATRGTLVVAAGGTLSSPATALTVMDLDVDLQGTFGNTTDLTLLRATLSYGGGDFGGTLASLTLDDTGVFEQRTQTPFSVGTLTVKNKGVYTSGLNTSATKSYEVDLSADAIDVQLGGSIDANGKGAPPGQGLGKKNNVAGHGGLGFNLADGQVYGSVETPTDLGTGGSGSYGGGAVRVVTTSLTVNGTIAANSGTGSSTYGGSGGSVWVTTSSLAGTGTILALGYGNGNTGSYCGAGGRVAVEYATLEPGATVLTQAHLSAGVNGSNPNPAGAGTAFVKRLGSPERRSLVIDNFGFTGGGRTPQLGASESYDEVIVRNGAHYWVAAGQALGASDVLTGGAGTKVGTLTLEGAMVGPATTSSSGLDLKLIGSLTGIADLTIANGTWTWSGTLGLPLTSLTLGASGVLEQKKGSALTLDTLTVQSGGTLKSGVNTSATKLYQVWVEGRVIDVQASGTITASGAGAPPGTGPGAGGGRAGYGGLGQNDLGAVYGSAVMPEDLGSGGQSNPGGGAVKLVASERAIIDGAVSTNGATGGEQSGGSGGSILVITDRLAGLGTMSAIGTKGSQTSSQTSGGGRIAVHYASLDAGATILNAGRISTASGAGGAGTVVLRRLGAPARTLLRIDNGNGDGATTPIAQATEIYDDLEVRSGAKLVVPSGKVLALASDGVVTGHVGASVRPTITVLGRLSLPLVTSLEGLALTNQGEIDQVRDLTVKAATFFYDEAAARNPLGLLTIAGTYEKRLRTQLVVEGPVVIQSGGVLTHAATAASYLHNIDLKAISLEVQSGGKISADAKGFAEGLGPGAGGAGDRAGGAGHRGAGGQSSSGVGGGGVYSDTTSPLGSGGGDETGAGAAGIGGTGGGAIFLSVCGPVVVSGSGSITANANAGTSEAGGGSGGTVRLAAASLSGNGVIRANGGNAVGGPTNGGGGGGGGDVQLTLQDNTFTGIVEAKGGTRTAAVAGPGIDANVSTPSAAGGALCPEFGCDQSLCAGTWEPLSGTCDYTVSDGQGCEDNDACTLGDMCHDGACVGGPEEPLPIIAGAIATIVTKDATPVDRDLTAFESDCQSGPAGNGNGLRWAVEELDAALFEATVDPVSDILRVTPVDTDTSWTAAMVVVLSDPDGNEARQVVTVRHDISDYRLSLVASPDEVHADGASKVALTATLVPLTGLSAAGRPVTFVITSGPGRLAPVSATTDEDGIARTTFTPSLSVQPTTVRVTAQTASGPFTASATITALRPPPDLAIAPADIRFHLPGSGVRVFPGAANPTDPGATLEVRVVVKNRGGDPSPAGLALTLRDQVVAGGAAGSPRLVGSATLPAIAAGQTTTASFTVTFADAGLHIVTATADADDALIEVHEDDNAASASAEIGPPSAVDVIAVQCALNEASEGVVVETGARVELAGRADYRPFLPYDPGHHLGIAAVKGGVVSVTVVDGDGQPQALGDAVPAIGDDAGYRALHTIGAWPGNDKAPVGRFPNRAAEDTWDFNAPATAGEYTVRACVTDGSFTGCCDVPLAVVPPKAELECTKPALPGEPEVAPEVGVATTLASTIANTGGTTATAVKVRLLVDGASVAEQTIASLAPGATAPISFAWIPACGDQDVVIAVDPDNSVVERSEGDNDCRRTTPDIIADRLAPGGVEACRASLQLLAAAAGGMPTATYATTFQATRPDGASVALDGGLLDVSAHPGRWTVTATADGGGACGVVPERNESSNNSASLVICPAPSPWTHREGPNYDGAVDIVIDPLPRRYGEATTVRARVYNHGNITFAEPVAVKLEGSDGQDLDTDAAADTRAVVNGCGDGIEPGAYKEVTWTWTPRYVAGNEIRGVRVVVDPGGALGPNATCRADDRVTTRALSLDLGATISAGAPVWGVTDAVDAAVVHSGQLAPNGEGAKARIAFVRKNGAEIDGVERAITTPIAGTPEALVWDWTPDASACTAANDLSGLRITVDTTDVYAEGREDNNVAFVSLPNLVPTGIHQRADGCGSLFSFTVDEDGPEPRLALAPWKASLVLTDPDGVEHGPYEGGPYTGIGTFDIGPSVSTLRSGTWGARITVDSGTGSASCGDIPERDEADNTLATTFVLCPNPTPQVGRGVEASGPARFDHPVTLTATVRNDGTTAIAAPVDVSLGSDTVSEEGRVTAPISCANPLLPGETRTVTFTWTPRRDPRPRELEVTTDPDDTFVGECDETDNVATRRLWLDLSPWKDGRAMNGFGAVDIGAVPATIGWGTEVAFDYAIHDHPPTGDSAVLMLVPNGGGTSVAVVTRAAGDTIAVDTATIGSPSPSDPQEVAFDWTALAALCDTDDGLVSMDVDVDPTDFYDEDVETNNHSERPFPDLSVSEITLGLVTDSRADVGFRASDGGGIALAGASWQASGTITSPSGVATALTVGPFSGSGERVLADDLAVAENGTWTVAVDVDTGGGACGEVPERDEHNNHLAATFDLCPDAAVSIAPLDPVVIGTPQVVTVKIENVGNQTLTEDVRVRLVGVEEGVEVPVALDAAEKTLTWTLGNGLERGAEGVASFTWTPSDDAPVHGLRASIDVLDTRADNGAFADADCTLANNVAEVAFETQWGCRVELSAGAWQACGKGTWQARLERPQSGAAVAATAVTSFELRFETPEGALAPPVDLIAGEADEIDLPWPETGRVVRLVASAVLDDGSVCGAEVERTIAPGASDLFLFSDDLDFVSKNGDPTPFNRAEVGDALAIDATLHNGPDACLALGVEGVVMLNLGFEQVLLGTWSVERLPPGETAPIVFVPSPEEPAATARAGGFGWVVDDPTPWLDVFEVTMTGSANVDRTDLDDAASRALMVGELGAGGGGCALALAEPVSDGVIGAGDEETLRFRVHDLAGEPLAPEALNRLALFVTVDGAPPIPPKNLLGGGSTYEGEGVYRVALEIPAGFIGTEAEVTVVAECADGLCNDSARAEVDQVCRCDDGDTCTVDSCDEAGACVHSVVPPSGGPDATCDAIDDDCDGRTDEDYAPEERPCSEADLCADASGLTRCDAGAEVVDCDAVWLGIGELGDVSCDEAKIVVYLVVNDAAGEPYGTARCVREGGQITCDDDDGALRIYDDLLCPGVE